MHGFEVVQPCLSMYMSTELWWNIANRTEKATQESSCLVSKICHLFHNLHYSRWICINVLYSMQPLLLQVDIYQCPVYSPCQFSKLTRITSVCSDSITPLAYKYSGASLYPVVYLVPERTKEEPDDNLSLKSLCWSDKHSLLVKLNHWFIHLTNIY